MTLPLGSESRPLRVAMIGSGPSAFYAAEALFKTGGLHCRVDMFDRLPTPFGLVRGGVAPDHQNIKAVVRVYEKVADAEGFRFFGNVMLGRDLGVPDLERLYDVIVYAFGNESDRKLGVPGEELRGVHSATEFVGWYNGHPDFRDREFDLERARRVVVVGNGNVAMDVTRMLLRGPDDLVATDVADHALERLRQSAVREVLLLGRRGPAQAAFSPKEIQEIAKLEHADLVVSRDEVAVDPVSQAWLDGAAPRSAQRNVKFLIEHAEHGEGAHERKARCMFLVSPVEVLGRDGRVTGVRVVRNVLEAGPDGSPRARATGEMFELECDLVFKAVGYRGVPVPGVPFDERNGIVPNRDGRVLQHEGGPPLPGHYVVGWAKRGPSGLIGTNSPCSKATVEALVQDVAARRAAPLPEDDDQAIVHLLRAADVDFVTWDDWRRYDAWEIREGEKLGKVRRKLSTLDEVMAIVRRLRSEAAAPQ